MPYWKGLRISLNQEALVATNAVIERPDDNIVVLLNLCERNSESKKQQLIKKEVYQKKLLEFTAPKYVSSTDPCQH